MTETNGKKPAAEVRKAVKPKAEAPKAQAPKAEAPKAPGSKDDKVSPLNHTFLVKVAAYGKGFAAGLGIKAIKPEVLREVVADPAQCKEFERLVSSRIDKALSDAGVGQGIDTSSISDAVTAFVKSIEHGEKGMIARKIGVGEEPEPGQDGRYEYVLNPDNKAMHEVEATPKSSPKRWFHFVRKDEVLVKVVPPKPGKPGVNVKGESVPPPETKKVALEAIAGSNTRIESNDLLADCEGCCVEDAEGKVQVVPEIVVQAVNSESGNLPPAGVAKASVLVESAIRTGYGVNCSGNVFVGSKKDGVIEKKAYAVCANLFVRGNARGNGGTEGVKGDAILDVENVAAIQKVEGAVIQATRVVTLGDCRFAVIDADSAIYIGGNLLGGRTSLRSALSVKGNIGTSEGGSQTCIVIPADGPSRKQVRAQRAVHEATTSLAELHQKLEELEKRAAKRAKVDPYWSALLAGDYREPKKPVEANTLRQYQDWQNESKVVSRSIDQVRRQQAELREAAEKEADATGGGEFVIRVQGTAHLDVTIEADHDASEEEMEETVSYTVGKQPLTGQPLKALKANLAKEVRAFLDTVGAQVEERKEALDRMFEGAGRRPTGPEIPDKEFAQEFTWANPEGGSKGGPFVVQTRAAIRAREPNLLKIHTAAVLRSQIRASQIIIRREGPKVIFVAGPLKESAGWEADGEITSILEGSGIRGVSAKEFLSGDLKRLVASPA